MFKLLWAGGILCLCLGGTLKAKEEPKAKTETKKPLGTQGSWHGRLGSGKYGSAATLRTKPGKKKKKTKPKTLYLWAEGDLFTKLLDLKKKGATVDISGLLAPDGKNVKVESLTDTTKKKKNKKKDKNKK